ncbi:hypothetical protein ACHQM5_024410 [Ranunculus cassubicifolius]
MHKSLHPTSLFYHRLKRVRKKILTLNSSKLKYLETCLGGSKFGVNPVSESLQSQILNALHLGQRDEATKYLSTVSHGSNPLRADDFVQILDYCARSPDPLFGLETWRIMEEKEICVNKRCYMLVMQALTKGGYLEEALNWLSFLAQSSHRAPDLDMYNIFLTGCARMGSTVHVNACLELMENQMVGKSETTYMALLKLTVLQQNLSGVQSIWNQYIKYYSPSFMSLHNLIKSFTTLGDLHSACAAMQLAVAVALRGNDVSARRKGMFQSSKLDIPIPSTDDFSFRSCILSPFAGGLTRAVEGDIREKNVDVFSAKLETTVMVGTGNLAPIPMGGQGSDLGNPSRILWSEVSGVPKGGIGSLPAIKFLRTVFNNVMYACAKAKDFELAEKVFRQMEKLGLKPSEYSYGCLVSTVVHRKGVTDGFALINEMVKKNLKPCTRTLAIMSVGCSKILEVDAANALVDAMGETPHLGSFNALLAACDAKDQPERAVQLLAKMKRLKLKFDIRTYELLFSLFGSVRGPYEKGTSASRRITVNRINNIEMDMVNNGVQHSFSSMLSLMKSLGAEGMMKEQFEFMRMPETQVFLSDHSQGTKIFNVVLHTLVQARKRDMALQVFKDMKLRELQPDAATYSIMMNCCSQPRFHKSTWAFLSMMLRHGFSLQPSHYTPLIKVVLANDGFDEAMHLLDEMDIEGVERDVVLYNSILYIASRKSRIDVIEYIVERMHREEIQPDPTTLAIVMNAYVRRRHHTTALEALQVLSMRMISLDDSILEQHRQSFVENYEEGYEGFLENVVNFFKGIEENIYTAFWCLRWSSGLLGDENLLLAPWAPNKTEWAQRLSSNYGLIQGKVPKGNEFRAIPLYGPRFVKMRADIAREKRRGLFKKEIVRKTRYLKDAESESQVIYRQKFLLVLKEGLKSKTVRFTERRLRELGLKYACYKTVAYDYNHYDPVIIRRKEERKAKYKSELVGYRPKTLLLKKKKKSSKQTGLEIQNKEKSVIKTRMGKRKKRKELVDWLNNL